MLAFASLNQPPQCSGPETKRNLQEKKSCPAYKESWIRNGERYVSMHHKLAIEKFPKANQATSQLLPFPQDCTTVNIV